MKFESVQVFRALAANAVVLSHLRGIEGKYGNGVVLLPEWTGPAGPIGVHFFFVISGFVMAFVADRSGWFDFIYARVSRIYPIYWFYTLLILAIYFLAPSAISSTYSWPPSLWKSLLLWPDDVAPLLTVGWSLIFEMYFYVVMALIIAMRLPLRLAFGVWAVIVIVTSSVFYPAASPVLNVLFSPLTLEFLLRAGVCLLVSRGFIRAGIECLAVGAVLLLLGYVARGADVLPGSGSIPDVLAFGVPFALILYGGIALEKDGRWPSLPFLTKLGDASYSTYLGHIFVLAAMGRGFSGFASQGWAWEAVFLAACVCAANFVGIASYRLLERPSLYLLRRARTERPAAGAA